MSTFWWIKLIITGRIGWLNIKRLFDKPSISAALPRLSFVITLLTSSVSNEISDDGKPKYFFRNLEHSFSSDSFWYTLLHKLKKTANFSAMVSASTQPSTWTLLLTGSNLERQISKKWDRLFWAARHEVHTYCHSSSSPLWYVYGIADEYVCLLSKIKPFLQTKETFRLFIQVSF